MRVLSALILSTALALPLAAPVLAEDAMTRTISVTGTGTVEAAPDMATLMIGVTTQGATAAEALAANSKATDAVMDSPNCIAIDEAENRLHVQKAIMAALVR